MRFIPVLFTLLLLTPTAPLFTQPPATALPQVYVQTAGKPIRDEPKTTGTILIVEADGTDTIVHSSMGIELRGSSSKRFPKKGYGLELRTASGEDRQADLLGLGREEDFVLHGPYSDKSLIRNALAYRLAANLSVWSPGVRMVELTVNGDYRGVYLLTEKLKRDPTRIAIAKMEETTTTGDGLTGGYVLKIDKQTGGSAGGTATFRSRHPDRKTRNPAVTFTHHYPKPEKITPEQRAYIRNYIYRFEEALAGPDFADPATGYRKYLDVLSFVDFLIMTELAKDVDGYRISTYFHKQRDSAGGKLRMGPIWDFNIAFGNVDYCDGEGTRGWTYEVNAGCGGKNWPVPFWWRRLMEDAWFRQQLVSRWTELRSGALADVALRKEINGLVAELGSAAKRNFERWPVLGRKIWPNAYVGGSYEEEVEYLRDWLSERVGWLDQKIAALELERR